VIVVVSGFAITATNSVDENVWRNGGWTKRKETGAVF
jgi:hypothetical protein